MIKRIIVSIPIILLLIAYLSLISFSNGIFYINQQILAAKDSATKFPVLNIFNDFINNAVIVNPKQTNFSIYENPIYGIKIDYPVGWEKLEFGQNNANGLVIGFAPPSEKKPLSERNVSEFILENVMIGIKTIPSSSSSTFPKNVVLDKFVSEQISAYKEGFSDFQIVKSNTTFINNNPTYQVQYTHKDGRATFDTLQIWTISENAIYTILFNADPSDYPIYLPIIQKMTDSFVILNNNNNNNSLNNQMKLRNI